MFNDAELTNRENNYVLKSIFQPSYLENICYQIGKHKTKFEL